jgi:ribA/ribD-fused uncharacterized protein
MAQHPQVIEFNSKIAEYSYLSNFHPAPFTYNGKTWPTVEHAFQAAKFPDAPDLQEKIRLTATPAGAKIKGRRGAPLRPDWEEVKVPLMLELLRAKFAANPPLSEALKATAPAQLREVSRSDSFWGCGASGCGKNQMGNLLHQVRNTLIHSNTDL